MAKSIHLIASNIKSGGAKELLLYLVSYICENHKNIKLIVYVDHSIKINNCENIKIIYQKSKLEKIKLFTKSLHNAIYFGNLPPLVKSKKSLVYFHNPYLVMSFKSLLKTNLSFIIKYTLQKIYIKKFIHNVDLVACQTKCMHKLFVELYHYNTVEELPFYRVCEESKLINKKYDFCYVSLAHSHKNHALLFEAMGLLVEKNIQVSLVVTVENEHTALINKISKINNLGVVTIVNLGTISKEEVCKVYAKSKCLIFPSTEETFGLPLIEAVEMGLDVIASDLDYVYQVVKPSLVFDPYSAESIMAKMEKYLQNNSSKSECLVENKINTLLNKFLVSKI